MTSKNQIIALYKALLRESQKLDAYSFRRYALRKVHDSFKANKSLNDKNVIAEKVTEAQKNLAIIKRQALISQLYSADKLVIENLEVNKQKL